MSDSKVYNYKLNLDFQNGLLAGQFQKEIESDNIITTTIKHVHTHDDNVYIVFQQELSDLEKTQLDLLVSNHLPTTETGNASFALTFIERSWRKVSWYRIVSWIYPGNTKFRTIKFIKAIARKQSACPGYKLRIYDVTNGHIVCESDTLLNNAFSVVDLGKIQECSETPAIWELQIKKTALGKNKRSRAYVNHVQILT